MVYKIRASLNKRILKMKLTRPEWISICLHVSGHNLCCSFLLPDGKEKKADAEKKNLVKVSQDWCAG